MFLFSNKLFLINLLIAIIGISCACVKEKQDKDFLNYHQFPVKGKISAFLRVERNFSFEYCDEDICIDSEFIFPPISKTASTFIINKGIAGSYALTAGHVCEKGNLEKIFNSDEPKENLIKINVENKVYTNELESYDFEIVHVNDDKDLCLIYIKGYRSPSVFYLSKKEPQIGDTLYNIAAPLGIFGKNMVPHFHGIYSGKIDHGVAIRYITTVPARGGSSGSPLFNADGNVVGMIILVHGDYHEISMSPILSDIRLFLSEGIKLHRE